jgi:hypothetical protein
VRSACAAAALAAALVSAVQRPVAAQTISYRGFGDVRGTLFPTDTAQDGQNGVVDLLGRGELFLRPLDWLQFAAGLDVRGNNHEQVDDDWTIDISDRGTLRPPLSVRRLSATLTRGPLTVDLGKQFIRWGKADIVNPTDRFAPRDFINVLDPEFLAVLGVRAVVQWGPQSIDGVWIPRFTPSRLPLFDQRWAPVPAGVEIVAGRDPLPEGGEGGLRWNYGGSRLEVSLSLYDGSNNLPNITPSGAPADPGARHVPGTNLAPSAGVVLPVQISHPTLRMYGADAAIPTPWFTLKAEAGYFTTTTPATDEYVLYVVQLERQTGEWVFVGGYAGEVVTEQGGARSFAPDRGIARTLLGRASYTIDPNRSAAVEAAVRQNGDGLYLTGEYSQARGDHLRLTFSGTLIRGESDDFLGQYSRNSNIGAAIRYSF